MHGESNQICIGYWAFKLNYNTKHLHFQWNIDIYSVSIKHMTVWNGTVTMATRSLWKFGINKEILSKIPILHFEVETPLSYQHTFSNHYVHTHKHSSQSGQSDSLCTLQVVTALLAPIKWKPHFISHHLYCWSGSSFIPWIMKATPLGRILRQQNIVYKPIPTMYLTSSLYSSWT